MKKGEMRTLPYQTTFCGSRIENDCTGVSNAPVSQWVMDLCSCTVTFYRISPFCHDNVAAFSRGFQGETEKMFLFRQLITFCRQY
jgi:hypothetical protein